MTEFEGLVNNTQINVEDDSAIPSWGGNKVNEYRDIVLDTIRQIEMINTKQHRNSGTIYSMQNGQRVKIELEDTKKIYRQLIDFFEDMMLRYFDKEVEAKLEQIEENLETKYKQLLDNYILNEPKLSLKKYVEDNKVFPIGNSNTKPYEEKFDEYKQESYRIKFRELLLLFARKRDITGKRMAGM